MKQHVKMRAGADKGVPGGAGRPDSSVGWLPLDPGHRSLIERQRGA